MEENTAQAVTGDLTKKRLAQRPEEKASTLVFTQTRNPGVQQTAG